MQQMSLAIQQLSSQLNALAVQQAQGPTTVVVGGGSGGGGSGRLLLIVGTGVAGGAVYAKLKGWWSMSQIMPVTTERFQKSVANLRVQIGEVTAAVRRAKDDLLVRIGVVQESIEQHAKQIEDKIEDEVGSVRHDLTAFDAKLQNIDGKLDNACDGIRLLVGVVSDQARPPSQQRSLGGQQQRQQQPTVTWQDLQAYQERNAFSFAPLDMKPHNPSLIGVDAITGGTGTTAHRHDGIVGVGAGGGSVLLDTGVLRIPSNDSAASGVGVGGSGSGLQRWHSTPSATR